MQLFLSIYLFVFKHNVAGIQNQKKGTFTPGFHKKYSQRKLVINPPGEMKKKDVYIFG